MEISKTDVQKIIAYLSQAAELLHDSPKPHLQWRAALIRKMITKLNKRYAIQHP